MVEPAKEKEFLRKKFRVEEVLKKKFKMCDGGLFEVQDNNNKFPVFNPVLPSPATNHVSSPVTLASSFTRPSRGVTTTFPLPQLQSLNQTSVPQVAAKLCHSQPQHSYFHQQMQHYPKSSQPQQQHQQQQHQQQQQQQHQQQQHQQHQQQQQQQQHLQHHRQQQQQQQQIQLPQIHHLQQLKQQQQQHHLQQQQKHQQEDLKLLSQSPHHVSLPSHHQQHHHHQQQQQLHHHHQQQQQQQPMFRVFSPIQEPGEILLPPLQPVNQKHLLSSSVHENISLPHQDQPQQCQDGQKKAIPQPNPEPQSKEIEKDHKSTQVQSHVNTTVGYQKVEKVCPMRFIDLLKNLSHVEGTIAWCMDLGLIPSSHTCHRCGAVMQLKPCPATVTSDGYIWQCNKQKSGMRCDTSRSLRAGSWFSQSNLTLEEVLQITYWWTQCVSEDFLVYQTAVSKPSVLDWCNYCQELCLTYLMKQSQSIGGPGTVVEIDEAMFYGRNGHRLSGQCIFSGIQQKSNWSCFIFPVGEKTDGTGLIEIIERWVKPGTTVLCNWNPTDRLTDDGHTYLKFTHNMTFRCVEDMEVNDGCINENGDLSLKDTPVIAKNFWKEIRASSMSTESVTCETLTFDSAMAESIWRKQQGEEDIFLSFIKAVKFAYS